MATGIPDPDLTHGKEVESKYLLGSGSDVPILMAEFQARLKTWLKRNRGRVRTLIFDGVDRYFRSSDPAHVLRFRENMFRRQLTIKSLGTVDVREEVNIDVQGNIRETIGQFIAMGGWREVVAVHQSGVIYTILGTIEIVVYWVRRMDDRDDRLIVEVESLGTRTVHEAKKLIDKHTTMLRLDPATQCTESVFEMYRPKK